LKTTKQVLGSNKKGKQDKKNKRLLYWWYWFWIRVNMWDQINVAYILKLLAQLKGERRSSSCKRKVFIIDLLEAHPTKKQGNWSKIDENMPFIKTETTLTTNLRNLERSKVPALKLCEDEHLDKAQPKP
jgi:type I restriction enzyme R subunit